MDDEYLLRKVICKWCNRETVYGDMIWLNGKCMCLSCYARETEAKNED